MSQNTLLLDAEPETGSAAPLTREEAQALGFSDEELDALVFAGVLVPEERRGPWLPETLEHVDWVLWKRKQIQYEMETRQRTHDEAMRQLQKALQSFDRFGPACQAIVREHLPRKKDGSFARKSLILTHGTAKITAAPGGPKWADPVAFVEYVKGLRRAGTLPESLAEAVKVKEEVSGLAAVDRLLTEGERTWSLRVTPVKQYLAEAAPAADGETGEVLPVEIPGVEIEPPSERFSFE